MMLLHRSRGRCIVRNESGIAAVEFALVAPVFLALVFAMLETGVLMAKIAMVEDASAQAVRLIYTGQAPTKAALESTLCSNLPLISNCVQNINIELIAVSDFSSRPLVQVECLDSENNAIQPTVNYSTGNGGTIMLLRLCIITDLLTPGAGALLHLSRTANGRYQITSTSSFVNEPF